MSELIDRQAALDVLCDACGNCACPKGKIPRCSYYEKMQAIPAASPWHRVDEPPKQNGAFAVACVYDGKLYWYKGIYLDGKWLREGDGIEMPADYWMPIEPPKEDA